MLRAADRPQERQWISPDALQAALGEASHLSQEQRGAVAEAARSDGVSIIEAGAGTGKTTLARVIVDASRRSGLKVVGLAPSWAAADELSRSTGIDSVAIARWRHDLERGSSVQLDASTVILVDEAGMAGTRDMAAILTKARDAQAKVVLIGDRRQLEAVPGASPLKATAEIVRRGAILDGVRRQAVDWQRAASVVMARGDAEAGLRAYASRHRLELVAGDVAARDRVIALWMDLRAAHGNDVLIITRRNEDSAALNRAAREVLKAERLIAGDDIEVAALDRDDKTKRGLRGKVIAGKSAGSLGYGYQVKPKSPGDRLIVPTEAEVIRRIFEDYADGASPRAIAGRLNAEKIPGPHGRPWIDTTIRGQVDRGTGLLNNSAYRGEIVWNRCSYVRHPTTGKRVARMNPENEWEKATDETLRIVDEPLWDRVKARQTKVRTEMGRDENGVALNRAHRAKHLLSGLIVCGGCGSSFAMRDAKHYGCSNVRSKGTCTQSQLVKRADLERIVGDTIRREWMNEAALARMRADAIAHWQTMYGSSDGERAKLKAARSEPKRRSRASSMRSSMRGTIPRCSLSSRTWRQSEIGSKPRSRPSPKRSRPTSPRSPAMSKPRSSRCATRSKAS